MPGAAKPREPLVSVLVPAFNAEATLAETLRSALTTTYSKIEVIVVDDGSTDRTAAIAEEIARKDPRVRLLRAKHRGVSAALNHGLAQARGDYVARLDADDLWHPSKLAKQMRVMIDHPYAALVYTFVRYIDGDAHVIRDAAPQRLEGSALCQCLYEGIDGGGSSALFRRSLAEQVGYDENLAVWEDLLFHLSLAERGRVAFVPEYLVGYRVRPDSSSSDPDRSLRDLRILQRRITNSFPQIPNLVRRWSKARRLSELAQQFRASGRFAKTAALLAECLISDFGRTSLLLQDWLVRRFAGERHTPHRRGPNFADCDPEKPLVSPPPRAAALHKFEHSRRTLLRNSDTRIGERAAHKLDSRLAPAEAAVQQ